MVQQPDIKRRISILTIPIDALSGENFDDLIDEFLSDGKLHQIVLLDLWDFVRARGRSVFAQTVRNASLVLPTSRTLQAFAWFLRKRQIPRHLPFDFVIRLLTALEAKRRSVYLIGSRPATLQTATSNVRGSFPDLQVVGRCSGFFAPADEENIILAIRKASPSLILAGHGLGGRDKWLYVHRERFASGIALWAGPCIEMFAGKKKRTSRELWSRGMDYLPDAFKHPWRIYRLFVYLWILIVVLYYRIKKL